VRRTLAADVSYTRPTYWERILVLVDGAGNAAMAQAPVQYTQPVAVAPAMVYAQPYYARPYYPPVTLDIGY
jgi:hypothetical protein